MLHDIRWYLIPRLREEGPKLAGELLKRYLWPDRSPAVKTEGFPPGIIQGKYAERDFVPIVRGAAINLGFTQMSSDTNREYPRMIRLREFETPITGAFCLTQFCPELKDYYEIGREIAAWDNPSDVVEKSRYYLERPEE